MRVPYYIFQTFSSCSPEIQHIEITLRIIFFFFKRVTPFRFPYPFLFLLSLVYLLTTLISSSPLHKIRELRSPFISIYQVANRPRPRTHIIIERYLCVRKWQQSVAVTNTRTEMVREANKGGIDRLWSSALPRQPSRDASRVGRIFLSYVGILFRQDNTSADAEFFPNFMGVGCFIDFL